MKSKCVRRFVPSSARMIEWMEGKRANAARSDIQVNNMIGKDLYASQKTGLMTHVLARKEAWKRTTNEATSFVTTVYSSNLGAVGQLT